LDKRGSSSHSQGKFSLTQMSTFDNRSSYYARNYEKTAEFRRHRQTSDKLRVGLSSSRPSNLLEEERLVNTTFNGYHDHARSEEPKVPTEYSD
jgi:hypothetical protein